MGQASWPVIRRKAPSPRYRKYVTPDIPADSLTRIAPILEALERSFRPLAATLTSHEEPALTFDASEVPAK